MDLKKDSVGGRGVSGASQSNGNAAAERLRGAVGAATTGKGSREELEIAARALVDELRGRQAPPEQVLIQMKDLLAEAGLRASFPATDASETHREQATLYRDIITWSIRCYYEDGKAGTKPPV
jgi:hypothetical protein